MYKKYALIESKSSEAFGEKMMTGIYTSYFFRTSAAESQPPCSADRSPSARAFWSFNAATRIGGMKDVEKDGASFCEIIIYPTVIFSDSSSKHQNTYIEDNYDINIIKKGQPRVIKARKRGPCYSTTKMFQQNYLFGSYQGKYLFLDSLLSPLDFLYDNGKLVDLRMGLAYDDFLSYFIPSELTLDDARARICNYFACTAAIRAGAFRNHLEESARHATHAPRAMAGIASLDVRTALAVTFRTRRIAF